MLSTGLPSLDQVIRAVRAGDNIVWQVDAIADYAALVTPFYTSALRHGHRLVYFRFARHAPLVPDGCGAEIHRLVPEVGFEKFTTEIHQVIERAGRGTFYVFDCLSDLAADWYSDLMLGNFFMVTCPYLFELGTATYFGLLRDHHSLDAVAAIRDTTQLLVDVFRHDGTVYVHPLKVDQRHSPTMYLPHAWEGEIFRPLSESAALADMLAALTEQRVDAASRHLDLWDRTFFEAREALNPVARGEQLSGPAREIFDRLLRMMVTRDERVIPLVSRYFDLADLLAIRKRMIGTGLVGGKSVGMLLARAILNKADPRWRVRLETHDSFFVGSDVFHTFLVRNGCWPNRRSQRHRASLLEGAQAAQQRILTGTFPSFIRKQFVPMLEHFGQSPLIVRSSSLLEDGFGNAFTGKYESVFCPNQGSPDDRLAAFLGAVRSIYASTMGREALLYRARRGLLDSDEQMGILVQRVSGAVYGSLFYPQIAGVGLSYNPYVWSPYIDPEAGVIRLVFGLGTRAVERADDDYTRIVALNAPLRRPDTGRDRAVQYAQRRVDVIDLETNRCESLDASRLLGVSPGVPVELFATREDRGRPDSAAPWVLTFDRLLSKTSFVEDMREMLRVLAQAYDNPVDTEFTANFLSDGSYRINVVQCRPLQMKGGVGTAPEPERLQRTGAVLEARGTIIGRSIVTSIDRIVFVVPEGYARLSQSDRFSVARLIGRLTRLGDADAHPPTLMLIGPGRWGTKTASLGVPVSFAEIASVSVLCEIVSMGSHIVPDVSLGTHFFNDIVEANMLYMALYPGRKGNRLDEAFFAGGTNRLAALLPDEDELAEVVRVIDVAADGGGALYLNANCIAQRAVCYRGVAAT